MVNDPSVGVVNDDGVIIYNSVSILTALGDMLVKGRGKIVKLNLWRDSSAHVASEIFVAVGIVTLAGGMLSQDMTMFGRKGDRLGTGQTWAGEHHNGERKTKYDLVHGSLHSKNCAPAPRGSRSGFKLACQLEVPSACTFST